MDPVSNVSEIPMNNSVHMNNPVSASETSVNIPLPVKILSWLILISGIINVLQFLATLLFTSKTAPSLLLVGPVLFLTLFSLISGVAYIIISFGLRKMKKWSLYLLSVIMAVGIVVSMYNYSTALIKDSLNLVWIAIPVVVLAYLWTINKKFV